MAESAVSHYADAALAVARASGDVAGVRSELYSIGQAVASSDELRTTLSDTTLPAGRRQQVVEELLQGRASEATLGIVSMLAACGRGRDIPTIVDTMASRAAASGGMSVAEVRTAVALSDDQQARLAEALTRATGDAVEIHNVVDPTVVGGVVAQIGDRVIDGSVRSKLAKMRESMSV